MNKAQKEYAKALENFAACEAKSDKAEREFIKENGLSINRLYQIEEDKEFDRLSEKFYAENARVLDNMGQAREILRRKEKALVTYALSIMPSKLAGQLQRRLHIVAFRQKIIDGIMQLDPSTAPCAKAG